MAQAPELSVVCRSCGSEVSPYVTECPYCGHRIRKRAPKLEREGDEIRVRETRRDRRRRRRRGRAAERSAAVALGTRPMATGLAL
ncbi:MAG TPA: zinc-ribbon domain-containing protein, partial [Solirubrobacterales bacterium]|nr:zinc-ribbon domain-containing protein [Solirubrobacterales bacterium]